jgi:hypothetical protein
MKVFCLTAAGAPLQCKGYMSHPEEFLRLTISFTKVGETLDALHHGASQVAAKSSAKSQGDSLAYIRTSKSRMVP